ncbi:hypothetical protein BD324DRAFT_121060 [Kockovaella imperatae]|uniref:Uncharacterized protein n=1 Tax=Kockovaella imperatae TaxID=4999 RepID=A0A1Y1UAT8_9TREE|nr:hypothetical protein BD324DRAFT_121060 [Kockovaella imperatae]ORX35161.1 hypothetical protein BD324DRAFT_121060 [Kockovaella imperatae]
MSEGGTGWTLATGSDSLKVSSASDNNDNGQGSEDPSKTSLSKREGKKPKRDDETPTFRALKHFKELCAGIESEYNASLANAEGPIDLSHLNILTTEAFRFAETKLSEFDLTTMTMLKTFPHIADSVLERALDIQGITSQMDMETRKLLLYNALREVAYAADQQGSQREAQWHRLSELGMDDFTLEGLMMDYDQTQGIEASEAVEEIVNEAESYRSLIPDIFGDHEMTRELCVEIFSITETPDDLGPWLTKSLDDEEQKTLLELGRMSNVVAKLPEELQRSQTYFSEGRQQEYRRLSLRARLSGQGS